MSNPPQYFSDIFERTNQRWIQLENDPELAAPWRQLFDQVQSPRHVVSELLQNADDVGASEVSTGISNEQFYFQHNGKDFSEDEFSSLCRFGYSNKRKLHTIGFRGIGFKSTFSIGEPVQVLTPTLAVEFYKKRFTLPNWLNNSDLNDKTRINVPIKDKYSRDELSKNLKEWTLNPVSLLFFKSIQKLTVNSIELQKRVVGHGPTLNSEMIQLNGNDSTTELKLFTSQEENFPKDAISEIQRDRNLDTNLEIPSCNVELVIGLQQNQRVYVVLPTGVFLKTPFSCNAPFIQDPARVGIKSPSTSPTNRWLLRRIGKLAAEAMLDWLKNESLTIEQRAEAYCLLPDKATISDSLEGDVNAAIYKGFSEGIHEHAFLLTTTGKLVKKQECLTPPLELYDIWTTPEILKVFDRKGSVLSGAINKEYREKLESWQFLDMMSAHQVIYKLKNSKSIPKPSDSRKLLKLWSFAKENLINDYYGNQTKELHIIPIKGNNTLFSYKDSVRIPAKREFINEESWKFLLGLIDIVDPEWTRFLTSVEKRIENGDEVEKLALKLYRDIGLNNPSDSSTIIKNAATSFFSRETIYLSDCVCLAHLAAALDARISSEFKYVTRDKHITSTSESLIATNDSRIEELLPEDWRVKFVLHDDYFRNFEACSEKIWIDWMGTEKSGLWPFAPIKEISKQVWSRNMLDRLLKDKNISPPNNYPYVTHQFNFNDFDFDEQIVDYLNKLSETNVDVWSKVVAHFLKKSSWYWQKFREANITQTATTGTVGKVNTNPIPSRWLLRLKDLPCLFDTFGKSYNPTELYLRNPETEPLIGVEPFVRSELDNETTRPFLIQLGVRVKPADVDKIVERIKSLAKAPDPNIVLSQIINWYKALDRALVNTTHDVYDTMKKVFISDSIILTSENKWAKSTEVFVNKSEDYPEAFAIHPAINTLNIWIRIGIPNHPTSDLIIEWISSLPSDEVLNQDSLKRIRFALQRYPLQIWGESNHWLAMDNSWRPVVSFKYRMTMQSLTKYADLFPPIKSKCANLQMLNKEVCENVPFAHLPDMEYMIEYRLTNDHSHFIEDGRKPKWIELLGKTFKRIKFSDENQRRNIYSAADRLENSIWLGLHKADLLQVTPFIDNIPAGIPQDRKVFWYDKHILVKDGELAKSFQDIVYELSRPFENSDIKAAINACIARDESFILDYMTENFDLENEKMLQKPAFLRDNKSEKEDVPSDELEDEEPLKPIETDGSKSTEGQPNSNKSESGGSNLPEPETEPEPKTPHKKGADLFERYVTGLGYRWNSEKRWYTNHDGSWFEESYPPFQWKLKTRDGKMIDYWVSSQCLKRQAIEIPYALLYFIEHDPQTTCLLLLNEEGNPECLTAKRIISMKTSKKIEINVSKYRLRLVD